MNNLQLITLGTTMLLTSCSNPSNQKTTTTKAPEPIVTKPLGFKERHDSIEAVLGEMYDTTFASGYYIKYTLTDSNVIMINWGNKDFNRFILDETYPGWAASSVKTEWKGYIGLKHSAGPGQWTHTLLPKNTHDSTFYYFSDVAVDTIRNLILYGGASRSELILENIITKKKQKIKLPNITEQGFWTEGYDSISFVKEGLFIRWKTMLEDDPDFPPLEKVFKITISSKQ